MITTGPAAPPPRPRPLRLVQTARRVVAPLILLGLAAACSPSPMDAPGGAPSSASATPPTTRTYATRSFVVPFQVDVPDWLPVQADQDRPNFTTWERADEPAVRFLVPVTVYPAGAAKPTRPAADYLGYLLGLRQGGARFEDQRATTVGGRSATVLTATTDKAMDGSLGCPESTQSAPDCFGLQPDLSLRLAVVPLQDRVLLIWLRTPVAAPSTDTAAKVASFEQMLTGLRFTDAGPTPSQWATRQAAATVLDGVWSASWTVQELRDSPLLYDEGEVNDENWGTYTLKFRHGEGTETITNPRYRGGPAAFTYTVDGDTVALVRGNEKFVMRWTMAGDELRFSRDDLLGVGPTPYIIKPFLRQR